MRTDRTGLLYFLTPVFHLLVLVLLYTIAYYAGIFTYFPSAESISQWDAGWYKSIVEHGYQFWEGVACNVAFFPAFPYLWKFSGLDGLGISVLNYLIFSMGIALLARHFKFSLQAQLLLLSFPAMFFAYVPYSEALFFLFVSILFIGLEKRSIPIIVFALLCASVTRAASLFFLPTIVLMWMMDSENFGRFKKVSGMYLSMIMASVVGLLLVTLLQYQQTGKWFPFFGVQKYWGKELDIPEFPLYSWASTHIYWLDIIGLVVGGTAFAVLLVMFFKWLSGFALRIGVRYKPELVLALAYLSFITVFTLFNTHSINSVARLTFVTPFFAIGYAQFLNTKLNVKKYLIYILLVAAGLYYVMWKDFEGFSQLQWWAYFGFIVLYFAAQVVQAIPLLRPYNYVVLYLVNSMAQLYVFYAFMSKERVI